MNDWFRKTFSEGVSYLGSVIALTASQMTGENIVALIGAACAVLTAVGSAHSRRLNRRHATAAAIAAAKESALRLELLAARIEEAQARARAAASITGSAPNE